MKREIPKIIVIVGPTASGKSDLAVKIAKKYGGEIISADSRQVYRGMDIGTGKFLKDKTFPVPKSKLKNQNVPILSRILDGETVGTKFRNKDFYSNGIRHHLIDVASPKRIFTASRFKKLGEKAITDIASRNKIPIIVGGTGFYIDVLLDRMQIAEVPPNKKLREKLGNLEIEKLFAKLKKLDPERARTIEPKNKRRLIRALEIVLTTGKPVSSQKPSASTNYAVAKFVDKSKVLWIGVKLPKKVLEKRIKKRLEERLRQGMIKEVINLRKQGLSWKRLDDFGLEYRWISRYLKARSRKLKAVSYNEFMRSECYQNLLKSIIRYSKHQMTWFKRNKDIEWIRNSKEAEKSVKLFL